MKSKNHNVIDNRSILKELGLKILSRTIIPPLLTFLLLIAAFWLVAIPVMRQNLIDSKKEMTQELTNTAWDLIENYHHRVKAGEISIQEAQSRVKLRIKNLRYGPEKKDYFWIIDTLPRMIVHPYLPEMEGDTISDYQDSEGNKLFQEMVIISQKDGSGFVDYQWQWRDDTTRTGSKLSYVKIYDPWQWIIGTGIYLEEVNQKIDNITKKSNSIFLILGFIGLIFSIAISWNSIQREKQRIKTNRELQQKEKNLRITLNSIGDAVIVTDTQGKIVRINPIASQLTGYEQIDAIGKPINEIFRIYNNKTGEEAENPIDKVLEQGKIVGLANDTVLKARDGEEYQIADSGSPIKDENENLIGVVLVFRDITGEYNMQEALKENEKTLRKAQAVGKMGSWQFDLNNNLVLASEEAHKIYGVENNRKFTVKEVQDFVLPEYRAILDTRLKNLIEGKQTYDLEFKIQRPDDGEIRDIHSVAEYDYENNIVTGVIQDITERKKTEAALRESEERYRSIFETAASLIIALDENGIILDSNPRIKDILGYEQEEIIGSSIARIIHPDDFTGVKEFLQKIQSNTYTHKNEYRMIDSKGKITNVIINTSVLNNKKKTKRTICIINDITERKRAQQEKEELHEQLLQTQKLESIGTLAGGVAHDFNNIMTVIIGFTQLIMDEYEKSDPIYSQLQTVFESAERASKLAEQLLLFSRKQGMDFKIINLNTTISRLEKMLNRLIGEDVKMYDHFAEDLWQIKADEGQIEQVITNLVVNARDAMPEGGKLSISTQNVNIDYEESIKIPDIEPGNYILLSIEDSGHGIEAGILEKIFDPFFTTKGRSEGTGMGLSVVHGIIKKHKGVINVQSEPGRGTLFNIYLPAIKEEELVDLDEDINEDINKYRGQGETILIAEDEKPVLRYLEKIFDNYNYNFFSCQSGEEALESFAKHQDEIDLLISDVIMTGINGLELADTIKSSYNDIQIILTSGYTNKKVIPSDIKAKGYKFLQKPYEIRELLKLIRNVLDSQD